ncbi:MAG: PIG-L deacetylase family protein [Acidimicrobiales bacterium]|jgi:LmbE family N-acetylglucosaminyl deacetylase
MTDANAVEESGAFAESGGVVVQLDSAASTELLVTPEPVPESALVVVAHPDDVDFGAAGTVATWTALGCRVTYCIVTDGSAGSADPTVELSDLVSTRQREQREAGRVVGVEEVVFLGYPDGKLEPTLDVRRDISRVIRQTRPERILTQSPERNFDRIRASHPDHLAAGEATLRAVYPDARNPFAHPELLEAGLAPFEVGEVWLMASPQADRAVDITDTFDRKIAALRSHVSQLGDPDGVASFVRQWTSATAQHFGLGAGRLAEAFQVVNTR